MNGWDMSHTWMPYWMRRVESKKYVSFAKEPCKRCPIGLLAHPIGHPRVWHVSSIHICGMIPANVCHDSFTCVTWHTRRVSTFHTAHPIGHSCVWHVSSIHICGMIPEKWVPWLIHISDMSHKLISHTYKRMYMGLATINRLPKNIRLFCKRAL